MQFLENRSSCVGGVGVRDWMRYGAERGYALGRDLDAYDDGTSSPILPTGHHRPVPLSPLRSRTRPTWG